MLDIRETTVPGVGVRLEFTTEEGESLAVLVHKGGRREVMVYSANDPDRCVTALRLNVSEAHALSEMLGASRVSEVITSVEHEIEGLSIDWLTIRASSPLTGVSIESSNLRSRTGVSIVAVSRGDDMHPAPTPDFVLQADDVAVVVGTPPDIESARALLSS